jgi:hypothetical protein
MREAAVGNRLATIFSGRPTAEQAARAELCAAIEAYKAAGLELESKNAAVQRLHSVIADAGVAERAAEQAEAAATSAAAAWASAGANAATADQTLIDLSLKRRQEANVALVRAKGAQQALPGAQHAVEGAARARNEAGDRVHRAVGAVLSALLQPHVAKLNQARRRYLEAYTTLHSVEYVINYGWGSAHPWHVVAPPDAALSNALDDLGMPVETIRCGRGTHPPAPKISSEPWAQLARRLATDADATFDQG